MENNFQFFNRTGQKGAPTKYLGTPGQQVEKRYYTGQNGTSGHLNLRRHSTEKWSFLGIFFTKFCIHNVCTIILQSDFLVIKRIVS